MFHDSPARCATHERGERVEVEVWFDRAGKATGRPHVALTIGTQARRAAYSRSWRGDRVEEDGNQIRVT